jgi:hypothetical protein
MTGLIFPSVRRTKIAISASPKPYLFAVIQVVRGNGDITIGECCMIKPPTCAL